MTFTAHLLLLTWSEQHVLRPIMWIRKTSDGIQIHKQVKYQTNVRAEYGKQTMSRKSRKPCPVWTNIPELSQKYWGKIEREHIEKNTKTTMESLKINKGRKGKIRKYLMYIDDQYNNNKTQIDLGSSSENTDRTALCQVYVLTDIMTLVWIPRILHSLQCSSALHPQICQFREHHDNKEQSFSPPPPPPPPPLLWWPHLGFVSIVLLSHLHF